MYTFLIDTHFSKVILLLYKNGKIIDKISEESNQSHSIITMPLIQKMLLNNKIDVKELDEIVVVNGPGSFTGVRIGVTIAKTIAYTLNIPIKIISSLEVIATNIDDKNNKIVAINDRNGYFIGTFDKDNNLIKEYYYLSNSEYKIFKESNFVYDNIEEIDYNKVYIFLTNRNAVNPHSVNPLYVKKIEVQK